MMNDSSPSPSEILPAELLNGYRAFLEGRFPDERTRFKTLAESGQKPKVMLISCCDSRVPPETIFDASPGELFVVRNVAALVPTYHPNQDYHGTSAALEFGVLALKVTDLVVMGHAKCGGVRAYAENQLNPYARPLSPANFIGEWMNLLDPAAERLPPTEDIVSSEYVEALSMASIRQSLINLRTFPWIRTLEDRGLLHLRGAYFDVADGRLWAYNRITDQFDQVSQEMHKTAFEEPRF